MDPESDRVFFNVPRLNGLIGKDHGAFNPHEKEIYLKWMPEDGGYVALHKYKGKFNMYTEARDGDQYPVPVWKKKFKHKLHKLDLQNGSLQEIRYLPKELLALHVHYGMNYLNVPLSVLPKGLVSLVFSHSHFPFNGRSLKSLKKLQVLEARNKSVLSIPKLPKSIKWLNFENSNLGGGFGPGLKNFKLKDHPNLKFLNVRGSGIKKKDIPQELLDAKKSKKIQFYY